MKRFVYISFATTTQQQEVLSFLDQLGIATRYGNLIHMEHYFGVRLRDGDIRGSSVIEFLEHATLTSGYSTRIEVQYDRGDLEPCEYVHLHVNRAARGDTGPAFGTDYDLSTGCPECGTGARQTSPLRINRGSLPKKARAMRTYHGEVLIDHELATDMMIELQSERGLRQVEDRKMLAELPWWQILPEASMPPAEASTGFTVDPNQCPMCRRAGFGPAKDDRPLEFTYRLSAAERKALPDFAYTWEHFGESRIKYRPGYVLGFAMPDILVSNRIMRLLWKAKIKGLQFVPVRFIE